MNINQTIDHTNLSNTASKEEIKKLVEEAIKYKFHSVCVHPYYVPFAKTLVQNSDLKLCTVVGFPLGQNNSNVKAFEAKNAVLAGADEIDMVANIAAFKQGEFQVVKNDILEIREAISKDTVLKVIIETCLLKEQEISTICKIAEEAGADFIKTSTGFLAGGANIKDIVTIKKSISDNVKIKASGGIRDKARATMMLEAGASRLGTSNSLALIDNKEE